MKKITHLRVSSWTDEEYQHTCLTNCRSRTSRDLFTVKMKVDPTVLMEDGIHKLYKVEVDVTTRDFVIGIHGNDVSSSILFTFKKRFVNR